MHDMIKKTIRGNQYLTKPFGAKHQLKLLPGVLRMLSGPVGSLVDSLKSLAGGPLQDLAAAQRAKGEKLTAADLKGLDVSKLAGALKGDAIRAGLVALADELEGGGADLIMDLLRDTIRMKGTSRDAGFDSCQDDFDTVFQSDFLALIQVLAWVVQVNYAPFLPSVSGK